MGKQQSDKYFAQAQEWNRVAHLDGLVLDLIKVRGLSIEGNAVQLVLQSLVRSSNDRLGAEVHGVGAPAWRNSSTLHVPDRCSASASAGQSTKRKKPA